MVKQSTAEREGRLEGAIGRLLISGVILSLLLEVAGIVLFYLSNGNVAIAAGGLAFVRSETFFTFLSELFAGKGSEGWAIRFMSLGVAVLILTPYLRAVFSVVFFAARRNVKYFLMTLFVVIVLTISLLYH